jgi:hypothetical protein
LLNKTNIKVPYWKKFTDAQCPTLAYSENAQKCYFNFTYLQLQAGIYQYIDLRDFSVFIDSCEAEVYMTLSVLAQMDPYTFI